MTTLRQGAVVHAGVFLQECPEVLQSCSQVSRLL